MQNACYSQPQDRILNHIQTNSQISLQRKKESPLYHNSDIQGYPKTHERRVSESNFQRNYLNNQKIIPKPSYGQSLKNQILSPDEIQKEYSKDKLSPLMRPNNNSTCGINNSIYTNDMPLGKNSKKLESFLPPHSKNNKKTLVLDLDETLVHSAFKPFYFKSDIILNVQFNQNNHQVHVLKRPYVDQFLEIMAKLYELVIFTASISQYANPLLDQLDKNQIITHRLFRQNCVNAKGLYIKDLKMLGRDLKDIIIVDNNPVSYTFNNENGLPILTWHYDKTDTELLKLIPLLEYLAYVNDVRDFITKGVFNNTINFEYANELINNSLNQANCRNQSITDHLNPNKTKVNQTFNDYKLETNALNKLNMNNFVNPKPSIHKYRTVVPSPMITQVSTIDVKQEEKDDAYYKKKEISQTPKMTNLTKNMRESFHRKTNSYKEQYNQNKKMLIGYDTDYNLIKNEKKNENKSNLNPPNISIKIVNNNISNLQMNNLEENNKISKKKIKFNPFIIPKHIKEKESQKTNQFSNQNTNESFLTIDENLLQDNEYNQSNIGFDYSHAFHFRSNSPQAYNSEHNNLKYKVIQENKSMNHILSSNGNFQKKIQNNDNEGIRNCYTNPSSYPNKNCEKNPENIRQNNNYQNYNINLNYNYNCKKNHALDNNQVSYSSSNNQLLINDKNNNSRNYCSSSVTEAQLNENKRRLLNIYREEKPELELIPHQNSVQLCSEYNQEQINKYSEENCNLNNRFHNYYQNTNDIDSIPTKSIENLKQTNYNNKGNQYNRYQSRNLYQMNRKNNYNSNDIQNEYHTQKPKDFNINNKQFNDYPNKRNNNYNQEDHDFY